MFIENLDTDDFLDRYYDLKHSAITYFLRYLENAYVQTRHVNYLAATFSLNSYIGKHQ